MEQSQIERMEQLFSAIVGTVGLVYMFKIFKKYKPVSKDKQKKAVQAIVINEEDSLRVNVEKLKKIIDRKREFTYKRFKDVTINAYIADGYSVAYDDKTKEITIFAK